MYSCHLFLISSVSVRSIPFLFFYCAHLCMKFSLGVSNFFEEISSVPHSHLSHNSFLYLFALITFLFLLAILWNSAFRCLCLSFSPFLFACLHFTAICKASSDSHFAIFFHFFSMGIILIPVSCTMSRTSVHSSSGTLTIGSNPLNLFLTSTA